MTSRNLSIYNGLAVQAGYIHALRKPFAPAVLILWKTFNQILITAYTGMFTYHFVLTLTIVIFVLSPLLSWKDFRGLAFL